MSVDSSHLELYVGDVLVDREAQRTERARTLAGFLAASQLEDLAREHDQLLVMLEQSHASERAELLAVFERAEQGRSA